MELLCWMKPILVLEACNRLLFRYTSLEEQKNSNILLYYKMLAFNNVLSPQRITIERAFGILICIGEYCGGLLNLGSKELLRLFAFVLCFILIAG